jgi:hypothetical protein
MTLPLKLSFLYEVIVIMLNYIKNGILLSIFTWKEELE